jgi:phospholipid/cholesterol/gamma-HCH transport system ATP-binding protein
MTAAPPPQAIQASSLRKAFGTQVVLDGIDLAVARGETLAILGLSGSGKSVLLKLIIGLQPPDAGSISIQGTDITGMPLTQLNEVRKKIGFVFQSAALYDSMSVEENVAFPLRRHTHLADAERRQQVKTLLASVGMENDAAKMPGEISGGMKKRVGLARALALTPDILLLDEPTAGLDPITAADIGELIVRVRGERELTSVIVTHDVPLAHAVSDRLALLRDGRILIAGTYEELRNSKDSFVQRFFHVAA